MGQFLDIAEQVLRMENRPLNAKEIIHKAQELQLLDFCSGLTPYQTVKARISENIRDLGENSRFKRTSKGVYALRSSNISTEYNARPFRKTIKPTERVLVFERKLLDRIGKFNGIKTQYEKYFKTIVTPSNMLFIPRNTAENDPKYKQILSYVIIKRNEKVLRFVRGNYNSAHAMLKGRECIGFGGHVQDYDHDVFGQSDLGLFNSIGRELREELRIPIGTLNNKNLKLIGVLNDDSSEVGKVHFAFIYLLDLNKISTNTVKQINKGERSINQLEYIPIKKLGENFEKYEYWSKLCVKSFFNKEDILQCKIHCVKNYSLKESDKVLAIVGEIGSGKTEARKIISEHFGYRPISSGEALQELLRIQPIGELGRTGFQNKAFEFISKKDGPEKLAEAIISKINTEQGKVVIDGLRNLETFEILKQKLKNITLIYVDSTVDNCYKFFKLREKKKIDEYEFYTYLNHPVEKEIKRLLEQANIVIYNHGTKASFQKKIQQFFKNSLENGK